MERTRMNGNTLSVRNAFGGRTIVLNKELSQKLYDKGLRYARLSQARNAECWLGGYALHFTKNCYEAHSVHGDSYPLNFIDVLTYRPNAQISSADMVRSLADEYGVPQNRERIFLVSIRNDDNDIPNFHFPQPFPLERRLKDVLEDKVDEKYYLSDKMLEYFNRVNDDKSHCHNFNPQEGGVRSGNHRDIRIRIIRQYV